MLEVGECGEAANVASINRKTKYSSHKDSIKFSSAIPDADCKTTIEL